VVDVRQHGLADSLALRLDHLKVVLDRLGRTAAPVRADTLPQVDAIEVDRCGLESTREFFTRQQDKAARLLN
jgi:hypothetical protein